MSLAPSLASSLRIAQGYPVSACTQASATSITSPAYGASPTQKLFAFVGGFTCTFDASSLTNSFTGGDVVWTLITSGTTSSESWGIYQGRVVGVPVGTTSCSGGGLATSVYLCILGYENCAGYGWFGNGSGTGTTPTFAVTPQAAGSMLLAMVNDGHGSSARTSTSTQIVDTKTNPGDNDSYWIEAPNEWFKAPGSYTYGAASPAPSSAFAYVAIEIQASPVVDPSEFPYFILTPQGASTASPRNVGSMQHGPGSPGRFRTRPVYPASVVVFDPSVLPWPALLPEFFARPAWNPDRSNSTRAGWTQGLWAVAPTKIPEPLLPERLLLPWNPDRSAAARAGWTQPLWAVPPVKTPDPVLPEAFARPIWSPERTGLARAGFTQATWAIPPTAIPEPVLPQSYARPIWNPERTGLARAGWTQALWAIPPQFIPEPVLPQFFYARQVWNPERSQLLWNPQQFASIVVPTWGYEMYGPQTFLRPLWSPDRTGFSRAGFTQQLWAVPPAQIPEPVLPGRFAYPLWNPERSHSSSTPLIIPRGPVPTTLPERYPPVWSPERTGVIIAQRLIIAPAPLLSWAPQLLERFVQALRSPPNLDLFAPALPPIVPVLALGPMLFGRQDTTALSGRADKDTLFGKQDATAVAGKQDAAQLTGKQDPSSVKGKVT